MCFKQPRDSNFEGLFALCCHAAAPLVAVPGRQVGHIHVVDFRHDDRLSSTMIVAHRHALAKIAISRGGELVASTSDEGTLVRIFDVATRQQLHEFRRGYVIWSCMYMPHPTPTFCFLFLMSIAMCSSIAYSTTIRPRSKHLARYIMPGVNNSTNSNVYKYLFSFKRYTSAKILSLGFNSNSSMICMSTDFSLHCFFLHLPPVPPSPQPSPAPVSLAPAVATSDPDEPEVLEPHFFTHASFTFDFPMRLACFWVSDPMAPDRADKLVVACSNATWREFRVSLGERALEQISFGRLLKRDPTKLFEL